MSNNIIVTGDDGTTAIVQAQATTEVVIDGALKGPKGDKGEKGDKGDSGSGISTGGTTGQVLTKNSNADGDSGWHDPAVQSVAGRTGVVTLAKSDVGLGNVDNTSDANKPVSTAQQTAIDAKVADAINDGTTTVAPSQNAVFDALALKVPTTRTVAGHALSADVTVSKSDVGLGSVTNDAQLKASDLDIDGTLAANSDTKIASQKAVKTYVTANAGSTPSATFTTQGKVLQSRFNVRDYGAVGNGTTDDTSAIQAAIDAASTAGGGVVFLPVATYKVTSLTLKSHVSILGDNAAWVTGKGTILKTSATSGDVLSYSATAGLLSVSVSDLRIEGPGSGTGNGLRLQNTGGNSKPNVNIVLRNLKVVNFGASGIELFCTIVSVIENVTSETCGTGFFFNGGVAYANVNTSLKVISCYANGCTTYGFRFLSTVYSSFDNLAADDCGTAYVIDTCNNVTFNSPGCEWGDPSAASPGDGYKITGCHNVVLNAPYTFENKHYSFWVTGSAVGVVLISAAENTPATGAVNSLKIDSGSYVTIIGQDFTTAVSDAGITTYLNDGTGGMTIPGYAYFGGVVEASTEILADNGAIIPAYDAIYNGAVGSKIRVLEIGSYGTPVNYIGVEASPTGASPDIYAAGSDTNIDLVLNSKGTGRIKHNAAIIPTVSSTDVLTGKSMSGASNTFTAIPLTSAVTGTLPIANGGTGSATQNFVDLTTDQTVAGQKNFTGLTGFNTTPTHAVTLPTGSTGIALYNTADQTTNYERGVLFWNSNELTLRTQLGGTGTSRSLTLGTVNRMFKIVETVTTAGIYQFSNSTSGNGSIIVATGTQSQSSGSINIVAITPTYNQTSTAAATDLLINRTQTGVGSGAQLLIDAQVGGTSKFSVDNTGRVSGRLIARTNSTASSATPAINTDTTDEFDITALATNITSMTSSLTGTPINGQELMIRFKDNGTARTITWGASFVSSGVATLLATTVISKTHFVKLRYDSTAAKWVCMAVDATGY